MKLLTWRQVSDKLGVGKTTLYRMVKSGHVPEPVRLGPRTARWREDEVDAYIAGLSRGVCEPPA